VSKVLLISMTGIGNSILTLPLLEQIASHYPNASIDVVTKKPNDFFFRQHPSVNKCWLADTVGYRSRFAGLLKLAADLRKERYEISFAAFGDPRKYISLLAFLAGIRIRLGFKYSDNNSYTHNSFSFLLSRRNAANFNQHEVRSNLDLLRLLEVQPSLNIARPQVHISADVASRIDDLFSSRSIVLKRDLLVGFHLGCSEQTKIKRWAADSFCEVARICIEEWKAKVVLFGSQEEKKIGAQINDKFPKDVLDVAGTLNIEETVYAISRCNVFVSNDSGLGHIANVLRTPLVAVFGPSSYVRTGPFWDCSEAISVNLECSPCSVKGYFCTNEVYTKCLKDISPRSVVDACSRLLKSRSITFT
jgi:lipopolysaccharide heptosyltransferase II